MKIQHGLTESLFSRPWILGSWPGPVRGWSRPQNGHFGGSEKAPIQTPLRGLQQPHFGDLAEIGSQRQKYTGVDLLPNKGHLGPLKPVIGVFWPKIASSPIFTLFQKSEKQSLFAKSVIFVNFGYLMTLLPKAPLL